MHKTLLYQWVGGMTGFMLFFWKTYALLYNRQERYAKLFTLAVFSFAFSMVPSIQKMKSRKKRRREGNQTKVLLD